MHDEKRLYVTTIGVENMYSATQSSWKGGRKATPNNTANWAPFGNIREVELDALRHGGSILAHQLALGTATLGLPEC